MGFSVDEVFPNFTLFVLIIMPVAMAITILGWLIRKYFHRTRRKGGHAFDEILGYLPALYFLWPIYEIIQYFLGNMEWSVIMTRLFTTHLRGFTVVMLLAGIGQVIYYVYSFRYKGKTRDREAIA